jgi:hypothetical protein
VYVGSCHGVGTVYCLTESGRFTASQSEECFPVMKSGQLLRHNADQFGRSDDHLGNLSAGQGAYH